MFVAVDVGNSNITIGVFEGGKIVEIQRLVSDAQMSQEEYQELLYTKRQLYKNSICVIGSVYDELNSVLLSAFRNISSKEPLLITQNWNFGVKKNKSDDVGIDRLANVVEANNNYKTPLIVVDAGTATTFDILDKDGKFIGGAIIPGVRIQLKAMNKFTSKLPDIEPEESSMAIGYNTKDAMLAGVIRGHAGSIEKLIKESEKELGETATIVGTGGFITLLKSYIARPFDSIDKELTLKGIKRIYEINYEGKNNL